VVAKIKELADVAAGETDGGDDDLEEDEESDED
jgi:hypothetical protein